jgi:hypothetical protein
MKVTKLEAKAKTIHPLDNHEDLNLQMNMFTTRAAPYLPNFNNIPARTIDPPVLASTWAFGSQK